MPPVPAPTSRMRILRPGYGDTLHGVGDGLLDHALEYLRSGGSFIQIFGGLERAVREQKVQRVGAALERALPDRSRTSARSSVPP